MGELPKACTANIYLEIHLVRTLYTLDYLMRGTNSTSGVQELEKDNTFYLRAPNACQQVVERYANHKYCKPVGS